MHADTRPREAEGVVVSQPPMHLGRFRFRVQANIGFGDVKGWTTGVKPGKGQIGGAGWNQGSRKRTCRAASMRLLGNQRGWGICQCSFRGRQEGVGNQNRIQGCPDGEAVQHSLLEGQDDILFFLGGRADGLLSGKLLLACRLGR